MLADLKNARNSIYVEYFSIEPGHMWDAIVNELEVKMEQGVDAVSYTHLDVYKRQPDDPGRGFHRVRVSVRTVLDVKLNNCLLYTSRCV